jgi:hypothetical protein
MSPAEVSRRTDMVLETWEGGGNGNSRGVLE